MNYLKKIFTTEFFFQLNTATMQRSDWAVLIAGAVLVAAGLLFIVIQRTKQNPFTKSILSRVAKLFITIGLLELFWCLVRYEAVRWFGTRFAAAVVLLIGLIWAGFILKDYLKNHKSKTVAWEREQVKLKYLQR